ncbi:hypothetical protein [Sphingobium chungangianum]
MANMEQIKSSICDHDLSHIPPDKAAMHCHKYAIKNGSFQHLVAYLRAGAAFRGALEELRRGRCRCACPEYQCFLGQRKAIDALRGEVAWGNWDSEISGFSA